ncbi:MAG TPA: 50S ribosomal protein L17 [Candidatus Saccharimonadia bacterium]|jgi:large subunit ribosomal protein L17|nr:50S ribosomal protein L17 [Candidatus Saccharimonadia bacterium]
MHRHAYIGRKLSMEAGPRRALVRGQVTSLVLHEAITTTLPKAKEAAPVFERLVTYAKKGTLAGGRNIRRELLTENAVQKLLQELLPGFEGRQGGYTRIIKLENRVGDNAPMARLELVLNDIKPAKAPAAKAPAKAKTVTKKAPAKKAEAAATEATNA